MDSVLSTDGTRTPSGMAMDHPSSPLPSSTSSIEALWSQVQEKLLQLSSLPNDILSQLHQKEGDLLENIRQLQDLVPTASLLAPLESLVEQLEHLSEQLTTTTLPDAVSIQPLLSTLLQTLQSVLTSLSTTELAATPVLLALVIPVVIVALLLGSSDDTTASTNSSSSSSRPYPDNVYNPDTAAAYFSARPGQVLTRTVSILLPALSFGVQLLRDSLNDTNDNDDDDTLRGTQLAELLVSLGPTFIKVGQSLSIRTDLLSPGYIQGLTTLQDQVPPFSGARAMVEEAWGTMDADATNVVVVDDWERPIAAASLGQVFKGDIISSTDGSRRTVAIKVQRPDMAEQIALDMHILRSAGSVLQSVFSWINTDLVGTVDAWGKGFVDGAYMFKYCMMCCCCCCCCGSICDTNSAFPFFSLCLPPSPPPPQQQQHRTRLLARGRQRGTLCLPNCRFPIG